MIEIVPAQTGEALEHLITLAGEYAVWMVAEARAHYPDMNTDELASEHAYDDIRQKFPGEHIPPDGCCLVAMNDGEACGCIALGKLSEGVCEMRTLFVRPACRGLGVGRKLAETSIETARRLGYHTMRLDTLAFMHGAQTLYRSLGFYDIEPYLALSASLRRHICFFELQLSAGL
jgi:GNAT superfamily N-acetyltransferase